MKTLNLHFKVNGYCSMLLDVPDDYQIPSTNPKILWEDLKAKFGDQIEVDLFELDYALKYGEFPLFNSNIDHMYLDHFMRVFLDGDDGTPVKTDLDYVPFD